ncbi:hypothetical protein BMS3Abin15_00879 [bacterium BMS3Abin15]|nr:hypothetical protein BMS3Abin15_00879 [bacterium BMS3Abin15]HDH07657.1 LysM peptidoglycan-binding domain-containing protein [Candidatus Moranbacteria bacterium]HDZ85322.1 LysM peptidoglycan-binding domain-containing protein [Candidatus Moranbacteria bacterium]
MRNIFWILIVAISFVTLASCKDSKVEKQSETGIVKDWSHISDTGRTAAEVEEEQIAENVGKYIECEEFIIKGDASVCVYRIKEGDTQSGLARRFGYSRSEFARKIAKRGVKEYLYVGEKLDIPTKNIRDEESEEPERYYYPSEK